MTSAERLRDSALRLFAERGFQATGIRDLAAASGMSVASLYHYMSTKEDLLFGLMLESMARLQRNAEQALEHSATPVEGLAALTLVHVLGHGLQQTQTIVVDTELRSLKGEHRAVVVERRDRYEQLWRTQLDEGVRRGQMTVPDPRVTKLALLEMCTGVAHWFSSSGELSLDEVAVLHANLALALVQARQGRKRAALEDLQLPPIGWFHDLVSRSESSTGETA